MLFGRYYLRHPSTDKRNAHNGSLEGAGKIYLMSELLGQLVWNICFIRWMAHSINMNHTHVHQPIHSTHTDFGDAWQWPHHIPCLKFSLNFSWQTHVSTVLCLQAFEINWITGHFLCMGKYRNIIICLVEALTSSFPTQMIILDVYPSPSYFLCVQKRQYISLGVSCFWCLIFWCKVWILSHEKKDLKIYFKTLRSLGRPEQKMCPK